MTAPHQPTPPQMALRTAVILFVFVVLFTGLREIEAALEGGTTLTEDERARLVELRDLDLEGLDVLVLHREENCG